MSTPKAITKTKLLAVEGQDEVNFFESLLVHLNISDIQLLEIGGVEKFPSKIKALPAISGFKNLQRIGIVRDCEQQDLASILSSINHLLTSVNLPEVENLGEFTESSPSVGLFVMPNNLAKGMLEDLCLSAWQNTPLIACVNEFFNCIAPIQPTNASKARMLCVLSTFSPIKNSLGLAAKSGFIDFSHDTFESIRSFIRAI